MEARQSTRPFAGRIAWALALATALAALPSPPADAKPRIACADLAFVLTRCTEGRRIRIVLEEEARARRAKIDQLKREVRVLQDRLASPWLEADEQRNLALEVRARRIAIEELSTGGEEDLKAEGERRARPLIERLRRLAEELRVQGGWEAMVTDRSDPRWADCAEDLTRDLLAAADRDPAPGPSPAPSPAAGPGEATGP